LPIFGKILEYILLQRLIFWEQSSKVYGDVTFGFEQSKSHVEAVGAVVHRVEQAFSKGNVALLIKLDVSQAFPSAWHPAIFKTLIDNECPTDLIFLLKSFLSNRVSQMVFAGQRSSKALSASTVQGARLSPSLWKAVNKLISSAIMGWLKHQKNSGVTTVIADDNSILLIGSDEHVLSNYASELISFITNTMLTYKIKFSLSPDKMEVLGFSRRRAGGEFPSVSFRDYEDNFVSLQVVKSTKLLGVILDSKLTWKDEIQHLANKGTRILFEMKRIAKLNWGLSGEVLKTLYTRVVRPTILGSSPLWGPTALATQSLLNPLKRLDFLVSKLITKAWPTASAAVVQNMAGITPIECVLQERIILTYLHTGFTTHLPSQTVSPATQKKLPVRIRKVVSLLEEIGVSLPVNHERATRCCDLPPPQLRPNICFEKAGTKEAPDLSKIGRGGYEIYVDGSVQNSSPPLKHGGGGGWSSIRMEEKYSRERKDTPPMSISFRLKATCYEKPWP